MTPMTPDSRFEPPFDPADDADAAFFPPSDSPRDRAIDAALGRLLSREAAPDLTDRIAAAIAAGCEPRFATANPEAANEDPTDNPDANPTESLYEDPTMNLTTNLTNPDTSAGRLTWQMTWLTLSAAAVLALITGVLLQPDWFGPGIGDANDFTAAQNGDTADDAADTTPVSGDFRILGRDEQPNGGRVTVIETRELVVPHVADAPLKAITSNGNLTIQHDDARTDVLITLRVQADGDDATEAGRLVDAMGASVSRHNTTNALTVIARVPAAENDGNGNGNGNNGFGNGMGNGNGNGASGNRSVSVTIVLPGAVGVTARSTNGNMTLIGLGGDLTAATVNGNLDVSCHSGNVDASSRNGNVTIAGAIGDVSAASTNGNVVATDLTGSAALATTNGTVTCRLTDDSAGSFRVTTTNGSATVSVGPAFNGAIRLETGIGDVSIDDPGHHVQGHERSGNRGLGHKLRLVVGAETGTESSVRVQTGSVTLKVRE